MSALMRFNPPQSRVMRAVGPGRTVALAFGRGVGKSWFIRRLCYVLIAQWENVERQTPDGAIRGIRIVFLLPTFKQFRDVHSRAMLTELRETFALLGGRVDQTTFTVTFPGGSSIAVFPASEHGGQRARGIRADVVMLDEADDIDAAVFDEVVTPWFTEPWSLKIRIASGTPKRGRHGLLYRLYDAGRRGERIRSGQVDGFTPDELEALASFYSIHATYRDAPANVDQHTVRLARVTMPLASFEREYECNFDSGEGLVYPFDEAIHVQAPPALRSFREFIVGMDHGWVDPGVLLLIGVQGHGEDAVAWVLDEVYQTEKPYHWWDQQAAAMAQSVAQFGRPRFWPDTSQPGRLADLRALGLDVGVVDKSDKKSGIGRVAQFLFVRESETGEKWARLYVAPQCKNVIREFGLYRRKKLPDGTFDEEPEDKNDHGMDALMYGIVGRFGRAQNVRHVTSGR